MLNGPFQRDYCPECMGEGETMGEDGKIRACPKCHGSGEMVFRRLPIGGELMFLDDGDTTADGEP